MRSAVAKEMAEQARERVLRMSATERLETALRLGDEAVAAYAAANGISNRIARERLVELSERARVRTRLGPPPR